MEAAESLSKDGVPIVHLSIHSFTEKLNNQHRLNDIGFLYDPKRPFEKAISSQLKQELCSINPELKVRMNYPYLGTSDGLTNSLRKLFPDKLYAGIEIEMNQKHFTSNGTCKNNLADEIASAVENCFKHLVTR